VQISYIMSNAVIVRPVKTKAVTEVWMDAQTGEIAP